MASNDELEPILIEISDVIPEFTGLNWHEKLVKFYESQAETLCDALITHVPQALLERILAQLLKKCASSLRYSTDWLNSPPAISEESDE